MLNTVNAKGVIAYSHALATGGLALQHLEPVSRRQVQIQMWYRSAAGFHTDLVHDGGVRRTDFNGAVAGEFRFWSMSLIGSILSRDNQVRH